MLLKSDATREGITGKIVLITGGGTGIGAATAKLLADQGATVAIIGRRREKLDEVAAAFAGGEGQIFCYVADVTRKNEVMSVVDLISTEVGPIDVLVNNAGIMCVRSMAEADTDEWDRMIDTNIKGTLYGIAAVLPRFLARRSGHIINVSSVAGFKVFSPGGTVYSGTKFAVRAIAEGLRIEVGDAVRVSTIEPGIVDSDLKYGTTSDAAAHVLQAYEIAIPASAVARSIAFAIEQPSDVDVNEIVIRPARQEH